MNELEVLRLFIDEIESVTDATVMMKSHDEDHEPYMVILDNLESNRNLRSTNPFAGLDKDQSGSVIGEIHRFYYTARLDLQVQSEDEVEAYETRMDLISHFGQYERDPNSLSEDIVHFRIGDGGNRRAEFDPSVFRLFKQTQTFHFEYINEETVDADVLSVIEDNL